jgi:hypothetical protein
LFATSSRRADRDLDLNPNLKIIADPLRETFIPQFTGLQPQIAEVISARGWNLLQIATEWVSNGSGNSCMRL